MSSRQCSPSQPQLAATSVEQGEEVTITYRDQGLSGKNEVHDDYNDIEATIYASNFGAIVELDKAIYDWTDRVLITVTAPDHNRDSEKQENIGTGTALPVKVSTRQRHSQLPVVTNFLKLVKIQVYLQVNMYSKAFADGNIYTTATVTAEPQQVTI